MSQKLIFHQKLKGTKIKVSPNKYSLNMIGFFLNRTEFVLRYLRFVLTNTMILGEKIINQNDDRIVFFYWNLS